MRPILMAFASAALAASLAACGETHPADGAKSASRPQATSAAAPAAKAARGAGAVTAIGAGDGVVTIRHGPIPEVGWPAMTMAFKANPPALLEGIAVGDQVHFELKLDGGSEIVALTKD